ncbi:hypothetical protein H6P81_004726 [Aristolochia fimbriata]|uniref:Alpha/beta hydrolase fold-3 domain-containing protein n=1 Tax=Aristolochia fimbriata TaxID=158543 RepID=A0AAV7ESJ6_ARIFI|nr:hypothetical protein H6P81_004726 [Aristolochia fimbriata]
MEIEQREEEEEERTQRAFEHVVEPVIDPYAAMNIVRNADGSLTRLPIFPTSPPVGEEEDPTARCFSKDVFSSRRNNNDHNLLRLRIYRPNSVPAEKSKSKLPVLVFFHGGGFICFSADTEGYHMNAEEMACRVPAIVVSVDYRLAPENPLPAAYDDAVAALEWVRDESRCNEPWIRDHGDMSRCFLIGSSAGGNVAYRTALRTSKMDLGPVRIEGLILVQPFFGGVGRTESEVRLARDKILPSPVTDMMWELAFPSGSDRDHEFCNPMTRTPPSEEQGKLPRILVTGDSGDPLIDRQRAFVKMMEEKGVVKVVGPFTEGGRHGAEFFDVGAMEDLAMDVKCFVSSGFF